MAGVGEGGSFPGGNDIGIGEEKGRERVSGCGGGAHGLGVGEGIVGTGMAYSGGYIGVVVRDWLLEDFAP